MDFVTQDLRFGSRLFLKSPIFTLVVVVTLALGIGADTVIFSIANGLLFKGYSYPETDRLVFIQPLSLKEGGFVVGNSAADVRDLKSQSRSLEKIGLFSWSDGFDAVAGGPPERLRGSAVSSDLFDVLGVRPLLGRAFLPQEDRPGGEPVVMLSHAVWESRFGGNPQVVGQPFKLNGQFRVVVGVMPPEFDFPSSAQVWVPFDATHADKLADRGWRRTFAVARLAPGATLEQARAEADGIFANLQKQFPDTNAAIGVRLRPFGDWLRSEAWPLVILLGVITALVLAVACANTAGLMLGRSALRNRELAVRMALGAGRFRVFRQLLTESVLLGLLGGAGALVLAKWGTEFADAALPLPAGQSFTLDAGVFGFTFCLSVLSGVLFGLAPALQVAFSDLSEHLRENAVKSTGPRGFFLRRLLVVGQIAVALMLLICAGLTLKSFLNFRGLDLGFEPDRVLAMRLNLPEYKFPNTARTDEFRSSVLNNLKSLPGVEAAAVSHRFELDLSQGWGLSVPGRTFDSNTEPPLSTCLAVTPEYFRVMGIRLVKGRGLTAEDFGPSGHVVVIGERAAQTLWPGEEAVGKTLKLGDAQSNLPWLTVVGVTRDARLPGWWELTNVPMNFFVPATYAPQRSVDFLVRTQERPELLVNPARDALRSVDAELVIASLRPMTDIVEDESRTGKLMTQTIGLFGGVTLFLAIIGIFGVVSNSVVERTREIGIRLALGAEKSDILKQILFEGLMLVGYGFALGIPGAFVLARMLAARLAEVGASLDFEMNPGDPTIFLSGIACIAVTGFLGCLLPALRALKVDPMVALRCE